jgi:hypothetical protein
MIRRFKNIKNVVSVHHWTAYCSGFIISPRLIIPQDMMQQIILN